MKPPRPLSRRTRTEAPRLIEAIRDHSPYLASLMADNPAGARDWLEADPQSALDAVVAGLDAARFADEAQAMRALRRAKRETALGVALADLSGRFDVAAATEALTRFADAAVRTALRFVLTQRRAPTSTA